MLQYCRLINRLIVKGTVSFIASSRVSSGCPLRWGFLRSVLWVSFKLSSKTPTRIQGILRGSLWCVFRNVIRCARLGVLWGVFWGVFLECSSSCPPWNLLVSFEVSSRVSGGDVFCGVFRECLPWCLPGVSSMVSSGSVFHGVFREYLPWCLPGVSSVVSSGSVFRGVFRECLPGCLRLRILRSANPNYLL